MIGVDRRWRMIPGGLLGPLVVLLWLGLAAAGLAQEAKKLNKYTGSPEAIKEGRALYLKYGCSGCHGVGGGGGMALPLVDDRWKFGSSDEILFRLIKGEIAESVMPKVFGALEPDEIWKILAYVRSLYAGDAGKVDW